MNYENINKNTVNLLSKAKQSKAKQSHNCLLSNNFKFHISQLFKTLNFLSVFFSFEKTLSLRATPKVRRAAWQSINGDKIASTSSRNDRERFAMTINNIHNDKEN